MQSLQYIKLRLRAVKNIGQIAKAMEVVAATKMRKSQQIALATRPYAFKALELLEKMRRFAPLEVLPLTGFAPFKKTLVVIIASDRGLAGAFNTQVFRYAEKFIEENCVFATVGKKAEKFIIKKKLPLVGKFYGFGDFVAPKEVEPLTKFIIGGFKKGEWDRAITISMHFRTVLKQEPLVQQILPVDFEKIRETVKAIVPEYGRYAELTQETINNKQETNIDYLFEPSAKKALEVLIPHLVEMQIYHLVLEANASEHSARRVAMKNASENSEELFENFTLQYNKARQSSITNEMAERAYE